MTWLSDEKFPRNQRISTNFFRGTNESLLIFKEKNLQSTKCRYDVSSSLHLDVHSIIGGVAPLGEAQSMQH